MASNSNQAQQTSHGIRLETIQWKDNSTLQLVFRNFGETPRRSPAFTILHGSCPLLGDEKPMYLFAGKAREITLKGSGLKAGDEIEISIEGSEPKRVVVPIKEFIVE